MGQNQEENQEHDQKVDKRKGKCLTAKDDNSRENSHENSLYKDKSDNRNNDHQEDTAEGEVESVEDSGQKCISADEKHVNMKCLDGPAEKHSIESPITDEMKGKCENDTKDCSNGSDGKTVQKEPVGNLNASYENGGKDCFNGSCKRSTASTSKNLCQVKAQGYAEGDSVEYLDGIEDNRDCIDSQNLITRDKHSFTDCLNGSLISSDECRYAISNMSVPMDSVDNLNATKCTASINRNCDVL